ncbi:MAG: reverse transcriptase family protein [Kofleriaceae bacterium]
MLTLVELLEELKSLATGTDPDKLTRINALFAHPKAPAEYQVARHYVAHLLIESVDDQLGSIDPVARREAIRCAELVFPRNAVGRVLRRVYRDPDLGIRKHARKTAATLGFDEKGAAAVQQGPGRAGRFATSVWNFGAFPTRAATVKKKPAVSKKPPANVPAIANEAALKTLLGITGELSGLMRPGLGKGGGYIEFEIPKAKGGTRKIHAPRPWLRKIQRKILDEILAKIPTHDAAHGFVRDRSTVTNAKPHVGSALVVKLDLKDFFPTVHYRRVRGLFQSLGYNAGVASALAGLTTYRPQLPNGETVWPGTLPQGAPTSPAIANLTCRRLDSRLTNLAAKFGATYTRYADDLTFSFAAMPEIRIGRFLWFVDGICEQEGFVERPDKRRILRAKHQQRITGIVVNESVHVPRADRKRFRAILHNCAKHGVASQAKGNDHFESYLAGYAAYVHMVEPELGKQWIAEVARLLGETHG